MARTQHKHFDCIPGCPVEGTLSVIGGKWKGVILFHLLKNETLRFGELKRLLPNVTQRMLTNQLRELESDGLITRDVYAQVPPRVDYALSKLGRTLEPVIMALKDWGVGHFQKGAAKPSLHGGRWQLFENQVDTLEAVE